MAADMLAIEAIEEAGPPEKAPAQAASAAQMPQPATVTASPAPSLGPAALIFMLGAATASFVQGLVRSMTTGVAEVGSPRAAPLPDPFGPDTPLLPPRQRPEPSQREESILPDSESVEWVNMCVRKIWRVYQRGLENWISGLLQPVFDTYINDDTPPTILRRIRIARFTLNHEPPVFDSMQRRNSRKESDLNAVCSVRYSGGAKMLLVLELGGRLSGVEVPVMVEDFDLDARMWIKLRLAPMCPWIGVVSVAFVEQPRIQVQLNTYGMLPLMRIPVLQRFLRKLLTVELPGIMVLPQRLEINLPPSVTVLAEAAVGRDTVMRAVASAVLQADAMEQALYHALPMDAANVASAVTVPEAFVGELSITVVEGRNLPVWGFPWQSNPYCRIVIGTQAVDSKRERETGSRGSFRCPNWNQEFQFLVEDSPKQTVKITVYDSPYTGRVDVGFAQLRLDDLPHDGTLHKWLPVFVAPTYGESQGELFVRASYRAFDEVGDEEAGERIVVEKQPPSDIMDVQSAAEASARATVEASQGLEALAVAKAAAARAAARLRGRLDSDSERSSSSGSSGEEEGGSSWPPAPPSSALGSLDSDSGYAEQLVEAVRGQQAQRDQRAAALATELGQRAVARVTGKSTSPREQATLKKRVDDKIARSSQDSVEDAVGSADEAPPAAMTPRDDARAEPGAPDAAPASKDGAYTRTNVDFDLVAEGDGTSSSVCDVRSSHIQAVPEEDRGRSTPLLPGGLPGPQGRALDELMVREATTRVRAVNTAELAAIKNAAEGPVGGGGTDGGGDGGLNGSRNGGREGGREGARADGKRVVVADGKGHVIHPELSIQSDSAIGTGDLERIVEVLPRGVGPQDSVDAMIKPLADVQGAGRSRDVAEEAGSDQRRDARGGAGAAAERPVGQQLLEKTVDLVDDSDADGALAAVGPVEGAPGAGDTRDGPEDDQSRPWWKFGWGAEDSFTAPQPDTEVPAPRKRRSRNVDEDVASGGGGAEANGEGEFWGWAKGMAILVGLRRQHDPQQVEGPLNESEAKQRDARGEDGQAEREERPWWEGMMDVLKREEAKKAEVDKAVRDGKREGEDRALSTVIVSPDVPIEEIAAEIARVKVQQSQRSDEQNRKEGEDMLKGPVGQLQRLSRHLVSLNKPEIVLLCGLSGGVLVLLAVVAYRIELYMELIRALDAWR